MPPLLQTRSNSAAARSWSGVNITPKVESDGVEGRVAERQGFRIRFLELDRQAFGRGARAAALEQRRHVVGGGHLAPAARRGERGVAVAGGDVEHLLAGPEVERFAQLFADDLQRGADDGIVAGRPGAVLLGLEGGKVDLARVARS